MPLRGGHVRARQGRGLRGSHDLLLSSHSSSILALIARRVLAVRRSGSSRRKSAAAAEAAEASRVATAVRRASRLLQADSSSSAASTILNYGCSASMGRISAPLQRDITQAGLKMTCRRCCCRPAASALAAYLIVSFLTFSSLLGARRRRRRRVRPVHLRQADEEPAAAEVRRAVPRGGRSASAARCAPATPSPPASLMAAEEIPQPVGEEFKLLYDQQNFGMSLPGRA